MRRSILLIAIVLAACERIPGTTEHAAVAEISQGLSDPETARFRHVHAGKSSGTAKSVVCGEVNAKNKMGGYVGYQRFLVTDKGSELRPDSPDGYSLGQCENAKLIKKMDRADIKACVAVMNTDTFDQAWKVAC